MAENPYADNAGYTFDLPQQWSYDPNKLNPGNTYVNNTKLDAYPNSPESQAMQSYFSGTPALNISGNPVEVSGSITGLNRGRMMYGQDVLETGNKIKDSVGRYEDRLNGRDPITEALKQQKQQSQANASRQFAGRGVAGGVAAAAQEQAGRQKDIDIAASAYQQNAQNLKDYTNLQSTIAANQGTLEQLYRGNAVSGVQLQPVKNQTGLLGL
jgi:hypothetical protein